jgi:hypothetical protein
MVVGKYIKIMYKINLIIMENKWKLFKNYIHNELGITKEDIRQWVQDAVKEQAKIALNGKINNFDIDTTIKRIMMEDDFFGSKKLKDEIMRAVAKEIFNKFEFKLK